MNWREEIMLVIFLNIDNCERPLGISSGELDDLHFSASSELNSDHQSRFARLIRDYPTEEVSPHTYSNFSRTPRTAWCSKDVNLRQYIEIDLGEVFIFVI